MSVGDLAYHPLTRVRIISGMGNNEQADGNHAFSLDLWVSLPFGCQALQLSTCARASLSHQLLSCVHPPWSRSTCFGEFVVLIRPSVQTFNVPDNYRCTNGDKKCPPHQKKVGISMQGTELYRVYPMAFPFDGFSAYVRNGYALSHLRCKVRNNFPIHKVKGFNVWLISPCFAILYRLWGYIEDESFRNA